MTKSDLYVFHFRKLAKNVRNIPWRKKKCTWKNKSVGQRRDLTVQ